MGSYSQFHQIGIWDANQGQSFLYRFCIVCVWCLIVYVLSFLELFQKQIWGYKERQRLFWIRICIFWSYQLFVHPICMNVHSLFFMCVGILYFIDLEVKNSRVVKFLIHNKLILVVLYKGGIYFPWSFLKSKRKLSKMIEKF